MGLINWWKTRGGLSLVERQQVETCFDQLVETRGGLSLIETQQVGNGFD